MKYRIIYTPAGKMHFQPNHRRQMKRIFRVVLGIAVVALLLWTSVPDWPSTVDALEVMAQELGQGSGIGEAVDAFCLELLQGAQLG